MGEMNGHTEAIWSEKIVNAHLAKDGVLAIEVRLFRVGDKELGLVRVWASVRHSHDPPVVELSKICIRTPGGTGSTCRRGSSIP